MVRAALLPLAAAIVAVGLYLALVPGEPEGAGLAAEAGSTGDADLVDSAAERLDAAVDDAAEAVGQAADESAGAAGEAAGAALDAAGEAAGAAAQEALERTRGRCRRHGGEAAGDGSASSWTRPPATARAAPAPAEPAAPAD